MLQIPLTENCKNLFNELSLIQKKEIMFGLFKKKSEKEKLQEKYESLMKDSFDLSKSNRSLADQKYAEAMEIQKQLEELR